MSLANESCRRESVQRDKREKTDVDFTLCSFFGGISKRGRQSLRASEEEVSEMALRSLVEDEWLSTLFGRRSERMVMRWKGKVKRKERRVSKWSSRKARTREGFGFPERNSSRTAF